MNINSQVNSKIKKRFSLREINNQWIHQIPEANTCHPIVHLIQTALVLSQLLFLILL